MTNKRVGLYAGIDPTAPSLHIGHMLPFMVLGWAYVHGMKAVWLVSVEHAAFAFIASGSI